MWICAFVVWDGRPNHNNKVVLSNLSGTVRDEASDHGTSKKLMNLCLEWISRFL